MYEVNVFVIVLVSAEYIELQIVPLKTIVDD